APPAVANGRHGARRWVRWLVGEWLAIDREARAERDALAGGFDARALWVPLLAALVLIAEEYWGNRITFAHMFPSAAAGPFGPFGEISWWAVSKIVGYLLVPAIALAAARIP